MTKILKASCLITLLSGLASAQIVPALLNWDGADSTIPTLPKTLAETGFNKNNPALFKPYTVNVPQWRGFMESNRYIYLPAGQKVIAGDSVNYTFPVGTVLIRDTYIDLKQGDPASRVYVEAQIQIMKADKLFSRVTYRYKEDGTTAVVSQDDLLEQTYTVNLNGKFPEYGTPTVNVPYSRTHSDCNGSCHSNTTANGFITQQLNDGTQLNNLVTARVLAAAPDVAALEAAGKIVRWYPSDHPTATPFQKLYSYLAANCGHCHTYRNNLKELLITHSFDYFSKPPLNLIDGEKPLFAKDSASSYAIVRISKLEMPQTGALIPDRTTVIKMINFVKNDLAAHPLADGKSIFHATLNNNLLRFNQPGPAKLFDLTGKNINLTRIDGSSFLVTEILKPGIYLAKMGYQTCRVSHF